MTDASQVSHILLIGSLIDYRYGFLGILHLFPAPYDGWEQNSQLHSDVGEPVLGASMNRGGLLRSLLLLSLLWARHYRDVVVSFLEGKSGKSG